jgi:hypothetical protein
MKQHHQYKAAQAKARPIIREGRSLSLDDQRAGLD